MVRGNFYQEKQEQAGGEGIRVGVVGEGGEGEGRQRAGSSGEGGEEEDEGGA
jgi:hypothetical protein